jgi:hypothetical protein
MRIKFKFKINCNPDNIDKVVEHLEKDSLALIEWFSCNQMKANRDKFQALAIGKKSMDKNIVLDLPNLFKYLPSLFNTFNCLDAFLQMFEI